MNRNIEGAHIFACTRCEVAEDRTRDRGKTRVCVWSCAGFPPFLLAWRLGVFWRGGGGEGLGEWGEGKLW